MNGWGIHRLNDIYSAHVNAGLPDGRYVAAVAEPYTAGRLKAAWAVLTGRAYAFEWPKAGDLEDIFKAQTSGATTYAAPVEARQFRIQIRNGGGGGGGGCSTPDADQ